MFSNKAIDIYESYWKNIMNNQLLVNDMTELFLSRVSAFRYIASDDSPKKEKAKKYLLETMTQSEDEYNFPLKEKFVKNISHWDIPIILAKKCDETLCAIVYKIPYRSGDVPETIHEISFFKIDDGKYKYTHKYNLKELYEQFCQAKRTETNIRQIGDTILHQEAKTVDHFSIDESNELQRQVKLLQCMLTTTGGVGIAANQCSQIIEPLKIILAGVDYTNLEHVIKAVTRYPNTLFPQLKICINPVIVKIDNEFDDFAEGCLSVQGTLRGLVRRPKTVTVRYQDLSGNIHENMFSSSDARVMLHELDHLLNGKVYIQRIIEELSDIQCKELFDLITTILSNETISNDTNPFLSPVVIFNRDKDDHIVFDDEKVKACFNNVGREALVGLYNILENKIHYRCALGNVLK